MAVLIALGVTVGIGALRQVGLEPVPAPSVAPAIAARSQLPESSPTEAPTLPPADEAAPPSPTPTLSTTGSFDPVGQAMPPSSRVATRVAVPQLRIDLPVTRQTTPYPACDVAMYILELARPGQGGVTYLYAHAQQGNFLPLLKESLVNDGARMLGMAVDVYTGDNLRFTYRVSEVRRHVTSLDPAFAWTGGESVWLQTSEGQSASMPKLQVIATHVGTASTAYAAAHPMPRPTTC